MLPQIFFGRGLFWNLLGRDFYSKFVWLRVSIHRLFGGEFFFRYIWVEFYLQLFFGRELDMFHQVLYLWWIFVFYCGGLFRKLLCADSSSESCWVNMFLPIFWIQVSIEVCLARISLQRVFGFNKCRRQRCFVSIVFRHFLGRDISFQSFRRECVFGDSLVHMFSGFFS